MAYRSQGLVFPDYGPRWKLLRKLGDLHILGVKALEGWAPFRTVELGYVLKVMHDLSCRGEAMVVAEMLSFAMANMIGKVVLGRRLFEKQGLESNEFKDMVVELMTKARFFNFGDFVPSSVASWLNFGGVELGTKHIRKKFDVFLTTMIDTTTSWGNAKFLEKGIMKTIMKGSAPSDQNIFTAGTDTSSSIIEWALAEMLKNPKILNQAQEEMDRVIGRNRRLEESDIPKLPYLQAICKETFRKHPSTPLNLPRVSAEACEVNGCYIPKNTRLAVNIWAIGRDPDVWENPLDFIPERFLSGKNTKIDPLGNHFELIPFGSGRRICAGARMGVVFVEYILGTLVHSFDWKLAHGAAELNMDEAFGLALQKAVPLSAMVNPWLPASLYVAA
ncbi:flavonoid 3',5'-hydroxylase 2-like [Camellia sinensis]|uniref:flavonoid 3',5'-hydroxylase 2-like n=1 Tax=Camellia sinensis TaxID=4442 RepID=UPI0010355B5F|nr:flavonoid 3',5'-hydroxylase 2-like [Camellia sinensis]